VAEEAFSSPVVRSNDAENRKIADGVEDHLTSGRSFILQP
jgi:hypothetical protein